MTTEQKTDERRAILVRARAVRTLAKHRRWAEEMRTAGWIVGETAGDTVRELTYEELWNLTQATSQRCNELGMDK